MNLTQIRLSNTLEFMLRASPISFVLIIKLLVLSGLGFCWLGIGGAIIAGLISIFYSTYHFVFCDKIILDALKAEPALELAWAPQGLRGLKKMFASLAYRLDMPTPELYLFFDQEPLVFVMGRNRYKASVAISTGTLNLLHHEELNAILVASLVRVNQKTLFHDTLLSSVVLFISRLMFGKGVPKLNLRLVLALFLLPFWWVLTGFSLRAEYRLWRSDLDAARILGEGSQLAKALSRMDAASVHPSSEAGGLAVKVATAHLALVSPLVRHPWFTWIRDRGRAQKSKNEFFGRGVSARANLLLRA